MSFESTKSQFTQEHFTIVEIDAPIVNAGFGTPISAGGAASTDIQTYKFTDYSGILPESGIYKCLTKISETPTALQIGEGLAKRGSASISMVDFVGDPNPYAPSVTTAMRNQYGYLAKFDARNILTNRDCRIKNYRVNSDGSIDLSAAETRHYISKSFIGNGKGGWTLKLEDELSRVNVGETVYPEEQNGFLRFDINATQTSLSVDQSTQYAIGDTIRIGEELLKITSVSNIGAPNASIGVQTRGADIVYTETLSKTDNDAHSAGDEIFICSVSDNERLDDLLEKILLSVGIPSTVIPKPDWASEVDEWLPGVTVNTLLIESEDTRDVLKKILTYFMLDMWFDPVAREIKLSAINVWKESSLLVSEGNQIDYETIKKTPNENLRATRALVVYDKRYLARSESIENYNKGSLFKREDLEGSDFFGESKVKHFEFSSLIGKDAADLLTNRWVGRFSNPVDLSWETQERKLNFKTGDILDIESSVTVGFDGQPSTTTRAQVLSIQPKYGSVGREYSVKALSYEPSFSSGSEVLITGNLSNVNLYIQYAGAPSKPVNITFIVDSAKIGSTSELAQGMRAGAFPVGSKITLILVNGADLMGFAGAGGKGAEVTKISPRHPSFQSGAPENGENGGIAFDAEGVDVDIYFSGPTPSLSYPIADGYILAPSGGDGGFNGDVANDEAGAGGKGGDGRSEGAGGLPGDAVGLSESGNFGATGTDDRALGSFGQDGADNDAIGGLKGKGVVDNGGTVTFFGSNAIRYINGSGDH